MKRTVVLLALAFTLVWTAASAAGPWHRQARSRDGESRSISVGEDKRTYILHLPARHDSSRPLPLVLAFHGGSGTGPGMARLTDFDEIADREGFAVAYPNGIDRHWNDFRQLSKTDDVSFIRALIDYLVSEEHIDPKRVYATGISNGGFFSSTLACELTDKIAAIAAVAATMGEGEPEHCVPSRPISVLYMHGSEDPIVPIDGGAVAKTRGRCISQDAAVRFWRDFDKTGSKQETYAPSRVHRAAYSGGKDGTEVVQYVVDGAGHVWPGGSQYLPAFIVGHATNAVNATEVIWKFFSQHSGK